jgi:prefoldin alpha subunit
MSKEIETERKHELYTELKDLDEEIKKLNSHLEHVDEQLAELNSSKLVVNKFTELKKGDEMRVPITSGIYIKAELTDVKKMMVNVGSNVTVERSPEDVLKILDSQLMELSTYRGDIVSKMKVLIVRIEEIQKEFE